MNKFDISNLTIEEKIGQLIVFGFHSFKINDHVLNLVKNYKCGNVLLFARNVKDAQQLYSLNMNLQKLAKEELGLPMFITIDQEGGMVSRTQEAGTFFPGAMTISATNNPKNAYDVGLTMGKELKALGVNMNFAPVLDVNSNPKNPVIGVRSYSDKKEVVVEYGNAFIKALQKEGVAATAKHFPGHGDTFLDSHLALPTVNKSKEEIMSMEIYPFQKAIDAGIDAIMTTHIVFPAFDKEYPATMSKIILTDLLREKLGFNGLIVTDGMEMKAIKDNFGINEGCLKAVLAGANLLCICHYEDEAIGACETLMKAYKDGILSDEILNNRVQKILDFKQKYNFPDFYETFTDIKATIGNEYNKKLAYKIVEEAATLVKGEKLVLSENSMFIGVLPKATSIADDTDGQYGVIESLKRKLPNLATLLIPLNPDNNAIGGIITKVKNYQQIIIATYNANVFTGQIVLLEKLHKLEVDLHVISMRNPYDLTYAPFIKNYVSLYEYTPNAIQVLIKYLEGKLELNGVLPISE